MNIYAPKHIFKTTKEGFPKIYMLNTMLNTHMVYEKYKHTHNKKLNTQ